MEYRCTGCNYSFDEKDTGRIHLLKKNKCGDNPSIIAIDGKISCLYCNSTVKTNKLLNVSHHKCMPTIVGLKFRLKPYRLPNLPCNIDDICAESWFNMRCVLTYVKNVYCSPLLPVNHSIYITDLCTATAARVFVGKSWGVKNQDMFLDELITLVTNKLNAWITLDYSRREVYQKNYDKFMAKKNKDTVYRETRDYLRLMLYNYYKSKQ